LEAVFRAIPELTSIQVAVSENTDFQGRSIIAGMPEQSLSLAGWRTAATRSSAVFLILSVCAFVIDVYVFHYWPGKHSAAWTACIFTAQGGAYLAFYLSLVGKGWQRILLVLCSILEVWATWHIGVIG
jgi:hypothetical protein